MNYVILMLVMLLAGVQGVVRRRSSDEPPRHSAGLRGFSTKSAQLTRYNFRVDLVLNSTEPCGQFWRDASPKQTRQPVSAYRTTYREVLDGLAKFLYDTGNITTPDVQVEKLALRCVNPAPRFDSPLKRLSVVATLTPMTPQDMDTIALAYLDAERNCRVTSTLDYYGGGDWLPTYFEYKLILSKSSPVESICLRTLLAAGRGSIVSGEGGISAMSTTKAKKERYTMRVDYAIDDTRRCGDFWKASSPRQTDPPAAAYRSTIRGVVNAVIVGGIKRGDISTKGVQVRRMALRCVQPKKRFDSNVKRITVLSTFDKMTVDDINFIVGPKGYPRAEGKCKITKGIEKRGGASWAPQYFEYTPITTTGTLKYFSICVVGFPGCWTRPWNPNLIQFFDLGCNPS